MTRHFLISISLCSVVFWTVAAQPSKLQSPLISSVACASCDQNKLFVPEATLPQNGSVSSIVWSPDEKYLCVGSFLEKNIDVYDTSSWKIVSHIWSDYPVAENNSKIQFIGDSFHIVRPTIRNLNNENTSFQIWSITTNSIVKTFYSSFSQPLQTSPWQDSIAEAIAVTKDGKMIAASTAADGVAVRIYNGKDTKVIQQIRCQFRHIPLALAFSPDDHELVVGGCYAGNISFFDVSTGQLLHQTVVDPTSFPYNFITYSPNRTLIAVGSSNVDHGTVTVLRASDGSILDTLPNIKSVPFSRGGENATITNLQWIDNNHILASYDGWNPEGGVARVWDINTMTIVGEYGGKYLQFVSISPDGHRLAGAVGADIIIGDLK